MPSFLSRTLEVGRTGRFTIAAAVLFGLGMLVLPFGSAATALYFVAALVAVVAVIRREAMFGFAPETRFAVVACLLYFGLDVVGIAMYPNPGSGWIAPASSLHFLFLPVLLAALSGQGSFDPLRMFIRGVRVGAMLGGAVAVVQVLAGAERAAGGMINAIPFGSTCTLFAFLSLIGTGEESRRGRVIAGLAFAGGLLGSAFSQSRGGWLAIPVLALVLLLYFRARFGNRAAGIVAGGLAVIAVLVGVVAHDALRERWDNTVAMFRGFDLGMSTAKATSLDQRALLYDYGLKAVVDRPLLGYGPQNAVAEVRRRAASDGYVVDDYSHLHNEFLTETVGHGAIGLMTLLLVLAAPLVTALRSERDRAFADRLATAAMLTSGVSIFALTNLAFGHDLTNDVYAATLLAVCLSAVRSRRLGAAAAPAGGVRPAPDERRR